MMKRKHDPMQLREELRGYLVKRYRPSAALLDDAIQFAFAALEEPPQIERSYRETLNFIKSRAWSEIRRQKTAQSRSAGDGLSLVSSPDPSPEHQAHTQRELQKLTRCMSCLTLRQKRTIELIAEGRTHAEIGRELYREGLATSKNGGNIHDTLIRARVSLARCMGRRIRDRNQP